MESKRNQICNDEDILSTLEKRAGLNLFNHDLVEYQGFWYPDMAVVTRTLSAQRQFQAQSSDVFLCSAPKTGTTWLKALSFAIVSRTTVVDDGSTAANPFHSKLPHGCLPLLEISVTNRDPNNPLIATHLPFSSLPESVSGCRIVYVCRDPKDTFVSMYHFLAKLATSRNMEPVHLDKAFELFCNGESFYGPYWDHVLGYWNASLEQPDRILFLKYEEMMEDACFYTKKLAEFMGYGFTLEEEKKGMVEKIVEMCSFENLRNLEVNKDGKVGKNGPWEMKNNLFFREGRIRDWENHLTPDMAKHMDFITHSKLSGSDLNLLYHKK